jgi:ribosomal protein S27AE
MEIVIVLFFVGCAIALYNESTKYSKEKPAPKFDKGLYRIASIDYKMYIMSPEWYAKKIQRLVLDNYTCQRCGSKEFLEVHHKTYENLGKEQMEDLATVCRTCHQAIHDKYGRKGNYFPLN